MNLKDNLRFLGLVAIVFATTLGGAFWVWTEFGPHPIQVNPRGADGTYAAAGSFGDSYGYVNSLLSSLALAGAIAAIFLQTLELRWQREELQESQKTWHSQARAMATHEKAIREQTRVLLLQERASWNSMMLEVAKTRSELSKIDDDEAAKEIRKVLGMVYGEIQDEMNSREHVLEMHSDALLKLCGLMSGSFGVQTLTKLRKVLDLFEAEFHIQNPFGTSGTSLLFLSLREMLDQTIGEFPDCSHGTVNSVIEITRRLAGLYAKKETKEQED